MGLSADILNEFRQDLVSGEWVLFATGRAKRPSHFAAKSQQPSRQKRASPEAGAKSISQTKEECPFDNLRGTGQDIVWFYPNEEKWEIAVIKNKYPALLPGICTPNRKNGPFEVCDAIGEHEVVVYRDHDTHFAELSVEQLTSVIQVYKRRYKEIVKDGGDCLQHIMIFHNFGSEVGGSIYHPHSQIISMPILPPDISRSLRGSEKFYKDNGKRIYDLIVGWEIEQGKRIVYENDLFVAFCPFVSKYPYEIRIFPRDSHAHFEQMPDTLDKYLADAVGTMFKKIKKALDNPNYNFFVHTASVKEDPESKFHEFYTWHVEIIPKTSIIGGLELGSGVYINAVDPDEAAKLLRETSI